MKCYQFQVQSTLTPSFHPNSSTWIDPTPYDQAYPVQWPSISQEKIFMKPRFSTPNHNACVNSYEPRWNNLHFSENPPKAHIFTEPNPNLHTWEQNQMNFSSQAQYEEQSSSSWPTYSYSQINKLDDSSWNQDQARYEDQLTSSWSNSSCSNDNYLQYDS